MPKRQTNEQIERSLVRWKSKLKRSITMIDKLEKQLKRRAVSDPAVAPAGATRPKRWSPERQTFVPPVVDKTVENSAAVAQVQKQPDIGIPTFLQRKKLDPVAEEIMAEQTATKKAKAAGRIAKMKAKQSGATRKMPLTGRAALDAIRNG